MEDGSAGPANVPGAHPRGLHQVWPTTHQAKDDTTIDIIAIHGLETESPRTWEWRGKDGIVNWLTDENMLPAKVPTARIYTYNWNSRYFRDAPVQTLLGHSDSLLKSIDRGLGLLRRPLICIASCFGGLILAKAIQMSCEAENEHPYLRQYLVGVIFLATPFRGSDAAAQAQWQVFVGGIMGRQTSQELVEDLNREDKHLKELTQSFAETANRIHLGLYCFYETLPSEILKAVLMPGRLLELVQVIQSKTRKLLVTQNSACLDGVPRQGLEATHSGMNKFRGPADANFKHVAANVQQLALQACAILDQRNKEFPRVHFTMPVDRNEHFVGRNDMLTWLCERVPPAKGKDRCQRTAIHGLGGIGKTQLAVEAAYRTRDQDPECSIFWVSMVTANTFKTTYQDIGRKLQVPGINEDKADIKILVKGALADAAAGRWLLVLDNVDDCELLFGEERLCEWLPSSYRGSILITTRFEEICIKLGLARANILTVSELTNEEAAKMLTAQLRANHPCNPDDVMAICQLLTNLPLALNQAAFYLATTGVSAAKYLRYCQESDQRLVQLLGHDTDGQEGRSQEVSKAVTTTWLISFNHIARDRPLAAQLLSTVAWLVEKDVPIALFLQQGLDEIDLDRAVGTLRNYAFITLREDATSFDVHRLVQIVTRNWLREQSEESHWIGRVIGLLANGYPFPRFENREVWQRYLPHATRVAGYAADGFENVDCLVLLSHIAESSFFLGNYVETEKTYRKMIDGATRQLGAHHGATMMVMNNLATVLSCLGQYTEAEELERQVLAIRIEQLVENHPATLSGMKILTTVLSGQGDILEAIQLLRQTITPQHQVGGKDYLETLTSMQNLVLTWHGMGRATDAQHLLQLILDLQGQQLEADDPDTLLSMQSLALVFLEQRKYDEAEQLCRKTVDLLRQRPGADHPDTLASMVLLAQVTSKQGRSSEAMLIFRQTLDLMRQRLGPDHPVTLVTMHYFALAYANHSEYFEAEQLFRETLHLKRLRLGAVHKSTLNTQRHLARVLHKQGKLEDLESDL